MKHDVLALEAHHDWRNFIPEQKFGIMEWKRTFLIGGGAVVGESGTQARLDCAVMVQLLDAKGNLVVGAIPYKDFELIAAELAQSAKALRETGILPENNSPATGLN